MESEWLYKENSFDYIHSRYMLGAIGGWQEMIQRAYKSVSLSDLSPSARSLVPSNCAQGIVNPVASLRSKSSTVASTPMMARTITRRFTASTPTSSAILRQKAASQSQRMISGRGGLRKPVSSTSKYTFSRFQQTHGPRIRN